MTFVYTLALLVAFLVALVVAAKWIDYVVTATLVLTPLALAGAVVLAVT